jgi:preprotein translocase subunit YajC
MNSGFFILIILVLFLIWLVLVRPQRRRQLAHQSMVEDVQVGDEVLTAGGFFAVVRGIEEDEVTVELSPGNEARLSKRAIAAVFPPEEQKQALEPEPVEETQR